MRSQGTVGRWRPRVLVSAALIAVVCTAACSAGDGAESSADPDASLTEVTVTEVEDHALVGRLEITTDGATVPRITVTGDERTFDIPIDEPAEHTVVPVAGLRAGSEYQIEVVVGSGEPQSVSFTTGAVPEDLPALRTTVSEPERMAGGFTLFNLLDISNPDPTGVAEEDAPRFGWLVMTDAEGEVVWYHRADHPIGDARYLGDGLILHEYNDTAARVIDLFGATQQEWAGTIITGPLAVDAYGRQVVGDDAVVVATDAMHHEVDVLPDGNLVALSSELRTWDGFAQPLCGEDPATFDGTYDLISDVIVEFTPEGEIVHEYPLAEYLDPVDNPQDANVCGLPLPNVFPNWLYAAQGEADARDWTHSNGVILDEERNAFLVSLRQLDAILAIRRSDDQSGEGGDLLWRLGPGGDFALADGSEWSSYQHAPELQDDGTLLLYDNGNRRPGSVGAMPPGAAPLQSRAVQYRIDDSGDRSAWTVEQVWEHRSQIDGEPAYAAFVGDADRMENGNVLIVDGGLAGTPDGLSARIEEVVPAPSGGGQTVFELRVEAGPTTVVYRAERIPDLYG